MNRYPNPNRLRLIAITGVTVGALAVSGCSASEVGTVDQKAGAAVVDVQSAANNAVSAAKAAEKNTLDTLKTIGLGVDNVKQVRAADGQTKDSFDFGLWKSSFAYTPDGAAIIRTGLNVPGISANLIINSHCQNGVLVESVQSNAGQKAFDESGPSGIHLNPTVHESASPVCSDNAFTGTDNQVIKAVLAAAFGD